MRELRKWYSVYNFSEGTRVKKTRLSVFAFLLLFGVFALFNSLNNPRIQGLHGSDVVRLIAVGLCFGVGFGLLVGGRGFQGK